MNIKVINKNLFDQKEGALILTVDGSAKGMEGNLARTFARLYPDAWEELEEEIKYPINLGIAKIYAIHPDLECNLSHCIIASTLHHVEILDDEQKLKVISSALRSSLFLAAKHNVNIVNTAVLSGGWRLEIEDAFKQMVQTFLVIKSTILKVPKLNICVLKNNEFARIKNTLPEIKVNYKETENSIII